MNEAQGHMSEEKRCGQCGAEVPPGALEGLCPACLLRQGATSDSGSQPNRVLFEPPPVAEVARLFPQLEVVECIGKGGMGAVYKARQPGLDRWVALKLLPPRPLADGDFAERFTREARALARLNHPNIVAVHEFGRVEDYHYFLMEFVDGVNLRQLQRAGRLSPREALQVVPQICDALRYAHDEGVVHRDIKPENLLVDRKGRVKIADFGLAKILDRDPAALRLTGEGQVMGTPQYMAPEQIEHPLSVDHRADIFSLGVVFYEMLTGELPLGRFDPPSSRQRSVRLDVRLDEVVLHALEKEPDRRYQRASQVKQDVETISQAPGAASAGQAAVGTPPVPRGAPSARLSRCALVGALWLPFFFVMLWGMFTVQTVVVGEYTGPTWWQKLLAVTVLPLGLVAPFGTTLLGWVAVGQIHRSAGRLYGLPLALFDGLLVPLLILDAAILFVFGGLPTHWAYTWLQRRGLLDSVWTDLLPWCCWLTTGIAALLADVLIIRAAWRAAHRSLADGPGGAVPTEAGAAETRRKRSLARGIKAAVVVLGALFWVGVVSGAGYLFLKVGRSPDGDALVTPPLSSAPALSSAHPVPAGKPAVGRFTKGTAELVGVGTAPSENPSWWRPDGSARAEGPLEAPASLLKAAAGGDGKRLFALSFAHLPEGASAPSIVFEPPALWMNGGRTGLTDGTNADLRFFAASLPAGLKEARLRVGVAMAVWEPAASSDGRATRTLSVGRGTNRWSVTFEPLAATPQGVRLTLVHDVRDWEVRVVARDRAGIRYAESDASSSETGSSWRRSVSFAGLSVEDTAAFTLEIRPYQWIEFGHVAIETGLATSLEVLDAQPAAAHLSEAESRVPWGSARYGCKVRLRAAKPSFSVDESVEFQLDLQRSLGAAAIPRSLDGAGLGLDGEAPTLQFRAMDKVPEEETRTVLGTELAFLTFRLERVEENWVARELRNGVPVRTYRVLEMGRMANGVRSDFYWLPGKHRLRFFLTSAPERNGSGTSRSLHTSNRLEIEVLAGEPER